MPVPSARGVYILTVSGNIQDNTIDLQVRGRLSRITIVETGLGLRNREYLADCSSRGE
jgi:hypothetical protein